MPIHSSTVDALGVVSLLLVTILCIAGAFCIFYVLYFRSQIWQSQLLALRAFNAVWILRITLVLMGMLWGLIELLRLPLLRHKGGPFHSWDFGQQAALCRIYTVSSFGFVEPCFFLTALFLVQVSVTDAPFSQWRNWNCKTIGLILLCCLPVVVVQACFVLMSATTSSSKGDNEKRVLGLPPYFTTSFIRVNIHDEAMCTYPLCSTLVLGVFSCIYNFFFLWQAWRMLALVINKTLQTRVFCLVLALGMLLPTQLIFMGLSVLAMPGDALYEAMAFLGFLCVLLCILVGQGILVVQPIADALAVRWVFSSLPTRVQNTTCDHFVMPLFVFEMEGDRSPYSTQKNMLIDAAASSDGDTTEPISVSIHGCV